MAIYNKKYKLTKLIEKHTMNKCTRNMSDISKYCNDNIYYYNRRRFTCQSLQ